MIAGFVAHVNIMGTARINMKTLQCAIIRCHCCVSMSSSDLMYVVAFHFSGRVRPFGLKCTIPTQSKLLFPSQSSSYVAMATSESSCSDVEYGTIALIYYFKTT